MIEIWSDNGSTIVDIESNRKDSQELVLKLYNKMKDNCVDVVITRAKLKELTKFINMVLENENEITSRIN